MARVAVVGAGIAGLCAAYRLHKEGIEPAVFEASDRAGGVIRSEMSDGYLVEHGPNSIQSTSDYLDQLVRDLSLQDGLVQASEAARVRYIVRRGRPIVAPTSPAKLLTSDLFGAFAKMRMLREPLVPPAPKHEEESVAGFVRRRLGPEVLDYAMNPFVAGVFAGDAEKLSVRYAFPQLVEMEQRSGSILKAQIDRRSDASAATETHRMFSFRTGLEQLPAAIAKALGDRLRTSAAVRAVHRDERNWTVRTDHGDETVEAVIYAAPLHRLHHIELPSGIDSRPLGSVTHPPLSVVALGYPKDAVEHSLDAFGLLVPEVERQLRILGTLFTSTIFPGRAPGGHALLTSFVGGMRDPDAARMSSDDLFGLVHRDLNTLLGVSEQPVFRRHVFWNRSIPQYHLGYGRVIATIERLEREMPGWFMAGNYRSGVSIGDAAESGDDAARRCVHHLSA